MEIEVREEKGATIVALEGRLDAVSAPLLDTRISELLEGQVSTLILNFAGLAFISSAGLRCILTAGKKMKARNGRLMLTCARNMVMEVLKMSGFIDLLPMYESDEEALRNIG